MGESGYAEVNELVGCSSSGAVESVSCGYVCDDSVCGRFCVVTCGVVCYARGDS